MKNQDLVTGLLLGALLTIVFETECRLMGKAEMYLEQVCMEEESTGSIILSHFDIAKDTEPTDEKEVLVISI